MLTGSDDRTIPADHSQCLADELGPRAQLVVIPGAGHMVHLTHAAVTNRLLAQLLEEAAA